MIADANVRRGRDVTEHALGLTDEQIQAMPAGLKTQHRVPIEPQPGPYAGGVYPGHKAKHPAPYIDAYCGELKTAQNPRRMSDRWYWWTEDDRLGPEVGRCPFGVPGDTLWLAEDRIDMVVKRVWVERIQDIGDDNALAEGVDRTNTSIPGYATTRFRHSWDAIYAKRGLGWDANPWVWACEWKTQS